MGGVPCPGVIYIKDTLLICPGDPPPTPAPTPPTPPPPPPPATGCVDYAVVWNDNCRRIAGKQMTTGKRAGVMTRPTQQQPKAKVQPIAPAPPVLA
jgi:hypothetical protein